MTEWAWFSFSQQVPAAPVAGRLADAQLGLVEMAVQQEAASVGSGQDTLGRFSIEGFQILEGMVGRSSDRVCVYRPRPEFGATGPHRVEFCPCLHRPGRPRRC